MEALINHTNKFAQVIAELRDKLTPEQRYYHEQSIRNNTVSEKQKWEDFHKYTKRVSCADANPWFFYPENTARLFLNKSKTKWHVFYSNTEFKYGRVFEGGLEDDSVYRAKQKEKQDAEALRAQRVKFESTLAIIKKGQQQPVKYCRCKNGHNEQCSQRSTFIMRKWHHLKGPFDQERARKAKKFFDTDIGKKWT